MVKKSLSGKLKSLKVTYNSDNLYKLSYFFKLPSTLDLFYNVQGIIDVKQLKEFVASEKIVENKPEKIEFVPNEQFNKKVKGDDSDTLLIGEDLQKLDYKLSACCNPIPGDDVFGFVTVGDEIRYIVPTIAECSQINGKLRIQNCQSQMEFAKGTCIFNRPSYNRH